jgi:alpha-glucosidase
MKFEVKLALLSVWASAAAAASSFVRDERLSSVSVGHFTLFWDAENPYVMLTNRRDPGKVVFQTIPSQSFITVGFATDSRAPIVDGNYKVDEWTLFETPYQSIKKVEVRGHEDVVLSGEVWGMVTKATYEMRFFQPHDDDGHELTNQLSFEVHATPVHGTFNRLFLNYWCNATEDFYGFGTQFTHFNLKGRRVPILSSEQGIGRGAQPISFLLNFFGDRAGAFYKGPPAHEIPTRYTVQLHLTPSLSPPRSVPLQAGTGPRRTPPSRFT